MKIVITATKTARQFKAQVICDHCYQPITDPANARLLWAEADGWGDAIGHTVHIDCHAQFLQCEGRGVHHWVALDGLAVMMR